MTDLEILKNQRAVEHAMSQQQLEGLKIPPEAIADLARMMRGEMTSAEAIHAARLRFTHAKVFQ